MQERVISLIKMLIPELSELEAKGYAIDKLSINGSLMFDIVAIKDGFSISYSGAYKTNGGITTVSLERNVDDGTGEGVCEIADFTITRITKKYCLFEEEWRDIDDEILRRRASIVSNNPNVQMPYVGEVVVDNVHKSKDYKTYKKFGDKNILSRFVKQHIVDSNNSSNA